MVAKLITRSNLEVCLQFAALLAGLSAVGCAISGAWQPWLKLKSFHKLYPSFDIN